MINEHKRQSEQPKAKPKIPYLAGRCLSKGVAGASSARQSFLVPFCDDKKG